MSKSNGIAPDGYSKGDAVSAADNDKLVEKPNSTPPPKGDANDKVSVQKKSWGRKDGISLNTTQLVLLIFLCCQNATAPVLTRLSRSNLGGAGMGKFRIQNLVVRAFTLRLSLS